MRLKDPTVALVVRTVSLAAFALFSSMLSRASAQIVSTAGLTEISPPASVEPGVLESNSHPFIFEETASFQLPAILSIDVSQTGSVTSNPASPGAIPAGTSIDSYYLHFDKIGSSAAFVEANGNVAFGRDILGLIIFTSSLDDTDSTLGAAATLYPTLDPSRGTISEFGVDSFTLSADRRTVQFSLQTANRVDSLRIITLAEPSVLLGDANLDGRVDFLDIGPFIAILSSGGFQDEADIDRNGSVDFLDIGPFIEILSRQ